MRLKVSILSTTVILSLIGLMMIYSASSYAAEINLGDAFYYVKKQSVYFAAGLITMFGATRIKIEWLKKLSLPIYIVAMGLLLILFIPGVGQEVYGATRWINLGFITFQPSEIGKFALVIFLAAYMADRPPDKLKRLIIPLAAGLLMCVAVMLEPNMSITMCLGLTLLIMLFAGGIKGRFMAVFGGAAAAAVPALIFMEPYRIKRLMAFLDPWASPRGEGYQLIQSYYALGAGGWFGVGLFASRQKYLYLPFAESDFIFSVIAEETGLLGSVLVMAVFFILIISGGLVALRATDRFRRLLAAGITTVIAVQTLLNIAVVSGSIPPTGLPLPFISAGGSSLMVFMTASGLLVNIAGDSERLTNDVKKEGATGAPKKRRKK